MTTLRVIQKRTPEDIDALLLDAIELRAEVEAIKAELEDPVFVCWLLQRLLTDKPDLRATVRWVLQMLEDDSRMRGAVWPPHLSTRTT